MLSLLYFNRFLRKTDCKLWSFWRWRSVWLQVIRDELRAGKTDQEIYTKLTTEYGEAILYSPAFDAQTAVLWIGPVIRALSHIHAWLLDWVEQFKKLNWTIQEAQLNSSGSLILWMGMCCGFLAGGVGRGNSRGNILQRQDQAARSWKNGWYAVA